MSLMSIIIFCLYPLSPARRISEALRHMMSVVLKWMSDQRWIDFFNEHPDDPRSILAFEQHIATMEASIDLVIYLRARELLGLRPGKWRRDTPIVRRRSCRSFDELWFRLECCILRFAAIEHFAAMRARKLERLLAEPTSVRFAAGPLRLDASHRSTSPAFGGGGLPHDARCPPPPERRGRWQRRVSGLM